MTACPCAQEMLAGRARERLVADGFSDDEIERVFAAVPVATHNQRGIGTLYIGRPEGVELDVDARDLLHIVEQSMSSEIYELMKRSDEAAVVEKAHRQPALRRGLRPRDGAPRRRGLPGASRARLRPRPPGEPGDDPPPLVVAERSGLLAEIAAELESGDGSVAHHMTKREWLEAPSA